MIASVSMPVPHNVPSDSAHILDTPETIDRLAAELRARSDPELPHSFYVEQVRRHLAGRRSTLAGMDIGAVKRGPKPASVFHAWAMPD